jgi:phospholipid/cholesterol/gamma-HCH transport system substrate-binding protein
METKNVSIGLFVVGGLVLFGIGMFLIGDRHQVFARHIEYYSEFVNLAGLPTGAKVRVGGMDAGQVLVISVPDSPSSRFRVKWRIDAKLSGLIRADSVATIGTEGVVGETFVAVLPGSARAARAASLATIPSKEPAELSELLTRGNQLLGDADGMLKEVDGRLNIALGAVTTAVSNVNDLVVGVKEGRGTAGMLLRDDALAQRLRQTVNTTSSDLQEIMADLKAGRGPAGMLLRDEALAGRIRETVKNAQKASADLGLLVTDLNGRELPLKASDLMASLNNSARQVNDVIAEMAKPDEESMSAGANLRTALMNANTATSNLADTTEALKHNFLVRGFFKKRGYYNLGDISPEDYRREKAFTNPTNRRIWLTGSDLFETDRNGDEHLSAKGKAFLNGAKPDIESPIIIEGYWSNGLPADQVRLSRSRAVMVRQYLQSHFHLDSRDLGFVPLKNSPPRELRRTTWDGVCIVVLKRT